jgi:hemerythrin-like domain-containing protein
MTTKDTNIKEELRKLNKQRKDDDPIFANAVKEADNEGSPMDPPNAYGDEALSALADFEGIDDSLKVWVDEHKEVLEEATKFEKALLTFRESGFQFTEEISTAFNAFFTYFDEEVLPHNRSEERYLFKTLHERLIDDGEHGSGDTPATAVDIMEDDHVKFIQLGSLTFNILGLASRLPDLQSRAITYDIACHNGSELVELLKLHIFREDNILFPLAQKHLSEQELHHLGAQLKH